MSEKITEEEKEEILQKEFVISLSKNIKIKKPVAMKPSLKFWWEEK